MKTFYTQITTDLKQAIINDDYMSVIEIMDTFDNFSSLNEEEIEYLKMLGFDVPEEVVSTEPEVKMETTEQIDLFKYLYSESYIDTFLIKAPKAPKVKETKRAKRKSKPKFVRRAIKLNKVQKEIYSIISKIENEVSYKLLDFQIKKFIIQLKSDDYKRFSKFIYIVMSGVENKVPKQTLIGKLRFKLPRLPLKDIKDSRLYEDVLVKVASNLIQILLNKEVFKSEQSRHINKQTGELSSVIWIYRPNSIKFNVKYSGKSSYVVDPHKIRIRGTTKSVSVTAPMKKFIDKYTSHVNENIRFKRRPSELVDIYFGLLYYKENISNPKSKESIFDLKDRLETYRKNYDVIQDMSFDTLENKMYYDTRNRMYSSINHKGFALHGDKFESSNRECAKEYILEPDDIRRMKSHAVQLLSDKKLSQQQAELLYEPEMAKQLREPLTKFYKDILIYSKRLRKFDKRNFGDKDNPFDIEIVRQFCIINNIPHDNLIRRYGKWVYMMELGKELSKKVGDKSRFLLKEDTTNMGMLLSSLAFKSRKMARGTNILKGQENIFDTHQLNLDFLIDKTSRKYTRDDIKTIFSNPLNHGGGLKALSKRLYIGLKSLRNFIIENYGVSFLNFNIIANWIKVNYPNNGIVTWKLFDDFIARSVAYAESQKLSIYVIDNPKLGRDGKLYPQWKTVEMIQDMPISRIGVEFLNTGDKSLRINGGYANGDHAYESFVVRKVIKIFIRTNKTIFTTHDAFDMRGKDLFLLERILTKIFKREVDRPIGYYEDMCLQIANQLGIEPPALYEEEDKISSDDIADIVRCIIP